MTICVFGLRAAICPACSSRPQHSRLTAISCFAAAASTRLMPGSAGSVETLSRIMMRTPTVPFFIECVAWVIGVHRERRDQHRAVDANLVHRRDHLVTRDFRRSMQRALPRPAGMIALVGMHLDVDDRHGGPPENLCVKP